MGLKKPQSEFREIVNVNGWNDDEVGIGRWGCEYSFESGILQGNWKISLPSADQTVSW